MSFPDREVRAKCWGARDVYWACLDRNNIEDAVKDGPCAEFRKTYEQSCSPLWVKHFDRKRSYLLFKEKIEKDGYENIDQRESK